MYITHISDSTRVIPSIRMNRKEAVLSTFNEEPASKHSKGFYETRTFKTDNPKEKDLTYAIESLNRIVNDVPKNYYTFRLPKASGGFRVIEAPEPHLKNIQASVQELITSTGAHPHNAAYAYTKGRCAYDALVTHQRNNARWFLKIDVKDFFPSITDRVLKKMLTEVYPLGFLPKETADRIIDVATNKDNVLPQGSPLSPLLSNLIMVGFDHTLTRELRRFNKQTYTYTRYADDILISCPYEFKFSDVVDLVEKTFREHELPFRINRDKLRYASMAGRNWNLGLMYTADQKITVGQKRKRMLHSLVNTFVTDQITGDIWDVPELQSLMGNLAYLRNIEPDYHDKLIEKYNNKYNVDVYRMLTLRLSD